jgi:hypothetical protein
MRDGAAFEAFGRFREEAVRVGTLMPIGPFYDKNPVRVNALPCMPLDRYVLGNGERVNESLLSSVVHATPTLAVIAEPNVWYHSVSYSNVVIGYLDRMCSCIVGSLFSHSVRSPECPVYGALAAVDAAEVVV